MYSPPSTKERLERAKKVFNDICLKCEYIEECLPDERDRCRSCFWYFFMNEEILGWKIGKELER